MPACSLFILILHWTTELHLLNTSAVPWLSHVAWNSRALRVPVHDTECLLRKLTLLSSTLILQLYSEAKAYATFSNLPPNPDISGPLEEKSTFRLILNRFSRAPTDGRGTTITLTETFQATPFPGTENRISEILWVSQLKNYQPSSSAIGSPWTLIPSAVPLLDLG